MNNSFTRLIDGMNATLRQEVLTRLDDEFARGQVFGIINLLNTFKVRADWSPGLLVAQITAQREALAAVAGLMRVAPEAGLPPGLPGLPELPELPTGDVPHAVASAELLALRDRGNRAIGDTLRWLDEHRQGLPPDVAGQADALLRAAMRAELSIEMKNSPRPLFAEMSSGREDREDRNDR